MAAYTCHKHLFGVLYQQVATLSWSSSSRKIEGTGIIEMRTILVGLACLVHTCAAAVVAPDAPSPVVAERRKSGGKLPIVLGGLSGLASLALKLKLPARLLGREAPLDMGAPPRDARSASGSKIDGGGEHKEQPKASQQQAAEAEKFALTPDRLATISDVRHVLPSTHTAHKPHHPSHAQSAHHIAPV